MNAIGKIHSKLSSDILPTLLPRPPACPSSSKQKVIHDHLWGSSSFYPWEIALLDTPLLQRLRQIHQLGTASFTYPSAVHNRFSHTLGVTVLAGQLITNLRDKVSDGTIRCPAQGSPANIVTQKDVYTIRLAALLHDIGHCFFSHCTEFLAKEELAGLEEEISVECGRVYSSGEPPKPHELIAYAIITSPYFDKYWNAHIKPLFEIQKDAPEPCNFAKPIIGTFISSDKHYLTEILNGPYDVDKLEYLHRDAKSAGLAITYDRDRFFQKITLHYDEDDKNWQLVMGVHGIQSVEQMMLNKMMLAPYVYHHQKVLAADALVQDIGRFLLKEDSDHNTITINSYLDFLLYTDADLLASASTSKNTHLQKLLSFLRNRVFPKRCFILHKDFVVADNEKEASRAFSNIRKDIFENVDGCRKTIAEKIRASDREFTLNDIYITNTSQKAKHKNIAKSAMVLTQDNTLAPLGGHWVMGNWDETYSAKKEYVFFHISGDNISLGFDAVLEFLLTTFSVKLDETRIRRSIKLA